MCHDWPKPPIWPEDLLLIRELLRAARGESYRPLQVSGMIASIAPIHAAAAIATAPGLEPSAAPR